MKTLQKDKIFKDLESVTKADEKPRTLIVRISTPEVDRSNDIVDPMGMKAENFLKNPVVLFAHKYDEMPIAKCIELKAMPNGILATVEFPEEGVYDKADVVYRMYKEGFLNAWSIGFRAVDYDQNEMGGYQFKSWELFEFSSVPVPDNPGALTIMRSKGINVDALLDKKEVEDKPEDKKSEEKTEEKKDAEKETKAFHDVRLKDVSQVTGLSYLMGDLSYMIAWFEQCDVSESTLEKMKQAQVLLMDAIKEQAVIGQKNFDIAKMGRAISTKHEGLLKEACDHMKSAAEKVETVLSTVAEQSEETEDTPDEDGKSVEESVYKRLAKQVDGAKSQMKKADKEIGLTLKLLNEIKQEKGGEK